MEIQNKVNRYKNQIIEMTQALVQINSVKDVAKPGKPFGEGVSQALTFFLEQAEKLGFKTRNVDGYAGVIEMGQGEETLGILAHLDVVPEGTGWTYDPFGGQIVDNKLYGRGAIDDKGPAVASLYAMKVVKDMGIKLNKKVQLIVGTDEESGSHGIKYLFEREPKPTIGLSPDGDYPVIHAEKGILHVSLTMGLNKTPALTIEGGLRPNMVPESCSCCASKSDIELLKKVAEEKEYQYDIKENVFTLYGKSAHGSMPEKGVNACLRMIDVVETAKIAQGTVIESFVTSVKQGFGFETTGESINLNFYDDESGDLSLNVGRISVTETEATIVLDIRYPVTCKVDDVTNGIQAYFKPRGFKYTQVMHHGPLFVPADSPFIQTLLQIYEKYTGKKGKPLAIGGGTYARELPNAVAFGATLPETEDVMHQKNEYIDLELLILNSKIYADTIIALTT